MNTNWHDSAEQNSAIVKVEGTPNRDNDGKISRRELLSFSAIAELLGQKLREAGELAEEFARAKVAQETNTARKLAEEAAEIASRRESNEANAELVRQQATGKFIENVSQLSELSPVEQTLALAKIFQQDPEVLEQLEVIQDLVERLRLTRGLYAELPRDTTIAQIEQAKPNPGSNA